MGILRWRWVRAVMPRGGKCKGQKEDEDTEKGELMGEQLGLNEPRRRN